MSDHDPDDIPTAPTPKVSISGRRIEQAHAGRDILPGAPARRDRRSRASATHPGRHRRSSIQIAAIAIVVVASTGAGIALGLTRNSSTHVAHRSAPPPPSTTVPPVTLPAYIPDQAATSTSPGTSTSLAPGSSTTTAPASTTTTTGTTTTAPASTTTTQPTSSTSSTSATSTTEVPTTSTTAPTTTTEGPPSIIPGT